MKKIKLCFVFVLVSILVCGLTACGKGGNRSQSYTGMYDGSNVEIQFYHTMGSNLSDVLDEYIVEFNKIYPNISVKYTKVGSYDDVRRTISTELAAGAGPNIAYCYADHVALYKEGDCVAPLDDIIANQGKFTRADGSEEVFGLTENQINDFIEGYYNEGKLFDDGKMYMMPFSKSTEVLYYNKTFFDANELQVPDHWFSEGEDDKTSMEYVCKKIKEIDPNSIPLGYDSSSNWFITMCEQLGYPYTSATGEHFLFNNDQNKALWEKFRGWYEAGYLTTQEIYGTYTSGLFVSTEKIKSYMSIGSSAGATHQRPDANAFEVGISEIPQADKNNKKVISQGPSVCIFNKSNPQEVYASWLFVKYLTTSVNFQAKFSAASGYVPVLKTVKDVKAYADRLATANGYDNIAFLSAKVCLEQVDAYFTSPAFNGSSDARDNVAKVLVSCLSGKPAEGQTVKDVINKAFQDAIDECEYAAS